MHSDKTFSHILKSVGADTTFAQLQATIARVHKAVAFSPTGVSVETDKDNDANEAEPKIDIAAELAMAMSQVNELGSQMDQLSNLVALHEAQCDLDLPKMKRNLDSSIFDYRSAYDSTMQYTADWFANLLMSAEAKVDLATAMLVAIQRYTNDNTRTLQLIAQQDAAMMAIINTPTMTVDQVGQI